MITEVVDPLSAAANDAVESIISHYSQSVHLDSAERDAYIETARRENEGRLVQHSTSKVVNHWTEALHSIDASGGSADAASIALGLYPRIVRQKIVIRRTGTFRSNGGGEAETDGGTSISHEKIIVGRYGHLISRHYFELIRDVWAEHGQIDDDDDHTSPLPSQTATDLDSNSDAICLAVVALAVDVISLTAAPSIITTDEKNITPSSILEAKRIREETIPCLLKIMCLGFELLRRRISPSDGNFLLGAEVLQDAVMAATIAAASFSAGNDCDFSENRIDALSLHPSLSSKLSLSRALEHTLSEPSKDEKEETVRVSVFKDCFGDILVEDDSLLLSECIVDLSSRAVPEPWVRGEDHIDETGLSHVGKSSKELLHAILLIIQLCDNDKRANDSPKKSALEKIVCTLGNQVVSDAARRHFFGRSFVSSSTLASLETVSSVESQIAVSNDTVTESIIARNRASNQLPWPKPSSKPSVADGRNKTTLLPESRAHIKIPSRLCSMLRLCIALTADDGSHSVHVSSKATNAPNAVLENFLPVVYCLVDSIDATEQAVGGATLLALLNRFEHKDWTRGFVDTASNVVGISLKTSCSDSVALSILCRARFELELMHERLLETLTDKEKAERLRKIGIVMFEAVHKASYRSGIRGEDDMHTVSAQQAYALSALLGGAHPILSELADLPDEIAASVELVRPGLAVLLPIIGWDMPRMRVTSRQLQLSALACLEELMVGGHPIVPRHTGKILSELLGCICRAQKDVELMERVDRDDDYGAQIEAASSVACLGLYTARAAKILCGERAEAMLRQLIENGGYNSQLIGVLDGLL